MDLLKEIIRLNNEVLAWQHTANVMGRANGELCRQLDAKDTEIERLNTILRVSFSPLASSEIKE